MKQRTQRVELYLTPEEIKKIQVLADQTGRSRKNWLEHIVREQLRAIPLPSSTVNLA